MHIITLIVLLSFAAAGFVALNQGPTDKEFKRREVSWSRFERK